MSKQINELRNRAIKFLRNGEYNTLTSQMEADAICTGMHNLLAESSAIDDPAFISVEAFISDILVLDWVLWGDESVQKLGVKLAKIIEASDKMLPDPESLRHAAMDAVRIIKNDLAKAGNDRMNTMAKAQFTAAVTSITMTCGEIVRVLMN